jgi:hypothetical protein
MIWLYLSALFMVVTALIHSIGGEKRLLAPAMTYRDGILAHPHARKIFRGAWHLTSLFMVLTAAVMAWPDTDNGLKALVAAAWFAVGLWSLISTRGKHIGWPSLTLSGVTGLIGSIA